MTHRNVLQWHICAATKREDTLINNYRYLTFRDSKKQHARYLKKKEKKKEINWKNNDDAFLHFLWTLMKERHRGLKTVYFRNRTENGAEARARRLPIP